MRKQKTNKQYHGLRKNSDLGKIIKGTSNIAHLRSICEGKTRKNMNSFKSSDGAESSRTKNDSLKKISTCVFQKMRACCCHSTLETATSKDFLTKSVPSLTLIRVVKLVLLLSTTRLSVRGKFQSSKNSSLADLQIRTQRNIVTTMKTIRQGYDAFELC
jgi:hypothetical protein